MIVDDIMQIFFHEKSYEINCKSEIMGKWFVFDYPLVCKLYKLHEDIFSKEKNGLWDENYITLNIISILLDELSKKFSVEVFKLSRDDEYKFGDIAFIVTFIFPNSRPMTGMAFIEAKKDYPQNNFTFQSFSIEQMRRILKIADYSFYLFYSHHQFLPIVTTNFLKGIVDSKSIKDRKLNIKDIYPIHLSLCRLPSQIDRFLRGYDLDFSRNPLSMIKDGREITTNYLIHIERNFKGEITPPDEPLNPLNPNPDIYKQISIHDIKEQINSMENFLYQSNFYQNINDSGMQGGI